MTDKKKNKEIKKNKPAAPVIKKPPVNMVLVWACVAAIALITCLVFTPSLDNGLTNFDDYIYTSDNPLVASDSISLAKIFETPVASNYHPLTILSFALNYQNGKLNPRGYHLENVMLHVLNTILVFFFIFLLTRRNLLMAAIVSLFFGIHPMHVESVTWISERKDVLYVFFFMAGLITYLRYSETKKIVWYVFTLLLFILSCLSKGMAVVFPVILLLIDYLKGVKWERRTLIEKIPFFLLSVVFGIVAIKAQQAGESFYALNDYTVFQRLLFASYGAVMYIVKLFVPFTLSAFYPYPVTTGVNGVPAVYYIPLLILTGLIAAIIYLFRKKQKEIVFGLLFYFASVALVLQFISVGDAIMADRYSYLCYVGLLFIVAYLIDKVWSLPSRDKSRMAALMKYPVIIVAIIGAMVFSFQAYSRTQVWNNTERVWTDVITNYPNSSIGYYGRAYYYYTNNEIEKAMADLNTDLQLNPLDKKGYYNRAIIYSQYYKKNDLAISDYTKSIAIDPNYKECYYNRALLYADEGKTDPALADYTKAITIDPAFTLAYTNRGLLYSRTDKPGLAMTDYNRVIAVDSNNLNARYNRALLYLNYGKFDSALADLNKAIVLNPSSASFYYNRGLCYKALNQNEKAISDITKGIQLDPNSVYLYYNMRGLCYNNLQNYNAAIADFSKAIELAPSAPDYWLNRSVAEGKTGQNENAKADEVKAKQLTVPHP